MQLIIERRLKEHIANGKRVNNSRNSKASRTPTTLTRFKGGNLNQAKNSAQSQPPTPYEILPSVSKVKNTKIIKTTSDVLATQKGLHLF